MRRPSRRGSLYERFAGRGVLIDWRRAILIALSATAIAVSGHWCGIASTVSLDAVVALSFRLGGQ